LNPSDDKIEKRAKNSENEIELRLNLPNDQSNIYHILIKILLELLIQNLNI
jgi:hypothetical protein